MFGFDMTAVAGQLKAFQDQSERLVNSVEQIQKDIQLLKEAAGIVPRETTAPIPGNIPSLIHKVD